MVNDAISHLSPTTQRKLIEEEAKRRRTGNWPAWEKIDLSEGLKSHPIGGADGWTREVRRAYRNWVFCVLDRPLPNGGKHLAVSSLSGVRPSFHEMQRIKNELAGEDALAVEIYPPAKEMVDEADMFHIWVVPDRDARPFTWFTIYEPRK